MAAKSHATPDAPSVATEREIELAYERLRGARRELKRCERHMPTWAISEARLDVERAEDRYERALALEEVTR